ncbi:uncharacterized protein LOC144628975 [Oculina patagonica]
MARSQVEAANESDITLSAEGTLGFDDVTIRAIAEVTKNEGNDEYRRKDFSSAIKSYTEGIKAKCKDDELNAKLYSNRATAHFYLGNYHETLNDARTATELQPTYIKAIARGASACVKLHRYKEAITWCDKGLTIDKNNKALLELRTKSVDGLRKLQQNDPDDLKKPQTPYVKSEESAKHNLAEPCTSQRETSPSAEEETSGLNSSENEAIARLKLRLQLAKEMGNRAEEGRAYGDLGTAYYKQIGDMTAALYYYELYLNISKEVGDRDGERRAYSNIGNVLLSCGDFKTAIIYHERDLKITKELGDRAGEGATYGNLGNAYYRLGDFHKAIDYYERRLKIAKEVGDRAGEGRAYGNLGNASRRLGNVTEAMDYHEQHLSIAKEIGDRAAEGGAYCNIGIAYYSLGNFKTAKHYIEQFLEIAKELGDRVGEGRAYANLGNIFLSLGDFKKAVYYNEQRLTIAKEVGDIVGEGLAYCNLGNAYYKLCDYKKALEYHQLDLNIALNAGDRASQGNAYGNLGNDYYSLGDFQKAMDYNEKFLEISEEVGDRRGEGRAYGNLGNTCWSLGEYDKAIACHKCRIEITKEVGDRAGEGLAYASLGTVYSSIDDFKSAIDYFERHLTIAKETGNKAGEGAGYGNLGNAYHGLGEDEKAIDYQRRHLQTAKDVGDKDGEGRAYYGLGCSFESLNNLQDAAKCYQSSVTAYNDVRVHLQSKDEWKINLRNVYQTVYTALWRVFLKQGQVEEALLAAEQGRAQALKDLMEFSYGFELAQSGSHAQQETMSNMLRCISSQTVFLVVHKNTIFFWVCDKGQNVQFREKEIVEQGSPENVATPFQSLIQKAYNEIGVLVDVQCEDRSLDNLRDQEPEREDFGQIGNQELQFGNNPLETLYNVVIEPIADLVQDDHELLIVPDGPLCLAPFAAFLDPESRYLCESFRVRVIPSLTSLKLITECPKDYHKDSGALLVGDPYVQEIINENGEAILKQLPWAKEEVQMIGQILKTVPLTGEEATKEEVLKRLTSVALVHIAAHGSIETGEIALAPNRTRSSPIPSPGDFLLKIADILNVQLRAKLVVLSCCHSGRGKIKAEGVVGIARAFLGAGARSVLVALWAIDDQATMEFMKNFYQVIQSGRSASEALNQAMKSMRESDKFNEVKYWAPFVLIGDDVTLEFGATD